MKLIEMLLFSQGDVIVPADSYAVAKAKERHYSLYEKIAQDHQRIGAELEAQRALFESTSEKEFIINETEH